MFPNWYALQSRYYGQQPKQERKAFLEQFPELKEYWDWNRTFKASHPNVETYVTKPEDEDAQPPFDYSFYKEISPTLARNLYAYFYADKPLSEGANAELTRIWRDNNVGGDYESFEIGRAHV